MSIKLVIVDDHKIIRDGLRAILRADNDIEVVADAEASEQLMDYLSANTIDVILLDMNLPRKDGREVLEVIKNDHQLKTIPVIVLTTSKSERDIRISYENHANCYIVKPVKFEEFLEIIKFVVDFWINLVKLPGLK